MNRALRGLAAAAGAVLLLVALGAAVLAGIELRIPAEPLRARLGAALSDALGCQVAIDGALALLSGPRPGLDAASVSVTACPAAPGARAALDRLIVRARLGPLLRGEVRGVDATAEGVALALSDRLDAGPGRSAAGAAPPVIDVERVRLAPVTFTLARAAGAPVRFAIDALEASAPAASPTVASAHGTLRAEPWRIAVTAPALGALLGGTEEIRLRLTAAYAGAELEAHGAVRRAPLTVDAELAARTATAERLVAAALGQAGALGALTLRTRVAWTGERVELTGLELASEALDLKGAVRADWSGARPALGIDARASKLDLAALARWQQAPAAPRTPADTVGEIAAALNRADAEIKLALDRIANGPVAAQDLALDARLAGGRLVATAAGVVEAAPGEARIEIDARGPLAVDARVTVKRVPRETLNRAQGVAALDPRVGSLTATLRTRAPDAERLLRSLETRLSARDLRLALPIAGERIEARLRTAELDVRSQRSLRATAAGTLGGEPVTLELSGGAAAALAEGAPWPVQARLRLADARLDARGKVVRASGATHAQLALEFAATRLDRLTALFPSAPLPTARATLRGTADIGADAWSVQAQSLAVGASHGRGQVRSVERPGAGEAPLRIGLVLAHLDADELARSVAARAAPARAGRDARAAPPADLDLALEAKRAVARGVALDALSFEGRLRGGRVARAPFAFGTGGAKVDGTLDADFTAETPRYGMRVTASALDLARLVAPLAHRDIALRVGRLAIEGETRGRSVEALLEGLSLAADLEGATLAIPEDSALAAGARVAFAGRAETRAGAPLTVSLKGDAHGIPLALSGRLAPVARLVAESADSQPVDLALDLGDTRLELAGTVSVQAGNPRYAGRARLAGPSVGTLEKIVAANLPDLPRYAVSASVSTGDGEIALNDLAVHIGESAIGGRLAWRVAGGRVRLEGRLSGKRVRLEDLGVERSLADAAKSEAPADASQGTAALERDAARLARFVRAFDADLATTLEDVTSAGTPIGRASAALRIDRGQLALAPIAIDLASGGGTVRAEMALDARGTVPLYAVRIDAEGLEYGPFARAADPKSTSEGKLDLDVQLTSRGTPAELMRHASGTVDVLVVPRGRVHVGVVDLWSAGLLQNIFTRLDPGTESRLNCAVGSFDVADGALKSRLFLLDTTRVRVVGELELDFGTRRVGGRLAPRAKQPELFNAAPSVRIGGTFERPTVLPSPEAVVIGALRLYGFAYAYALDWITTQHLPADGTDDCRAAYRRVAR